MQLLQETHKNTSTLINPDVDFLMIGGLSIFFYIGFCAFNNSPRVIQE